MPEKGIKNPMKTKGNDKKRHTQKKLYAQFIVYSIELFIHYDNKYPDLVSKFYRKQL